MNIKNYTSSVASDKSILQIERILIEMGARNIAKEYDGFGKVDSISFSIPHPAGEGVIPFKLPAKREPIKKLFLKQYRRPTKVQEEGAAAQADRTAWKNVKEWVELQATMIKLEQVEFMEVFLPYVYNLHQRMTYFEIVKGHNYKLLGS
jgi:hypothetical protein